MRSPNLKLTLGLLTLLLLALSGSAMARELGAHLKGTELLVELAQEGPGPEPPGIYAVTNDGKLLRVVPFGRHPRWAPGRTRFAFEIGLETWIADLRTKRMTPAQDVWVFLDSPPQVLSGYLAPAIQWGPKEDCLIRWQNGAWDYCQSRPQPVPVCLWLDEHRFPGSASLVPEHPTAIGNVSITREGRVAYEAFDLRQDMGVQDRQVLIYDPATGKRRPVTVPWPEVTALLNPLWAASGRHLSMDCLTRDGRRFVAIVSDDGSTVCRYPQKPEFEDEWSRGLGWSPTSDLLLVVSGQEYWPSPRVVKVRPGEAPTGFAFGDGPLYTYQGCWSPDGGAIAVLQGQDPCLRASRWLQLSVVRHVGAPDMSMDSIRIPEHLIPVFLDW